MEEEVHRIEKKIAGDDDYADRLKKIEKYFRKMYDPNAEMNKEQVDAMAKAVIDRITVVPISENKMKLEVELKTGESEPMTYIRNGERYGRRSGLTSKKMIDAYKTGNKQ